MSQREQCLNTEVFQVRIFQYLDTSHAVRTIPQPAITYSKLTIETLK